MSPIHAGPGRGLWLLYPASALLLAQLAATAAHAAEEAQPAADVAPGAQPPAPETAATTPGAAAADAGYAALRAGDPKAAADRFVNALQHDDLAPDAHRAVVLTLSDTLAELGQPDHAAAVLSLLKGQPDYATASRLAFALDAAGHKVEAAVAYKIAAPLAPTEAERLTMQKGRVFDLAASEEKADALAAARPLVAAPGLTQADAVNLAYVAVKFRDDRLALKFFDRAQALAPLTANVALDAAYSARRIGADRHAVRYFKQSLASNAAPAAGSPAAQQRFQVRREVADLSRRAGGSLAVFYDDADSLAGRARRVGRGDVQVGGELYYRPFGFNGGRPVEVFARMFETVGSRRGDPTGPQSLQGWVGVRAKPITDVNLILEGSRLLKLGRTSIDDWELRAAYSASRGMDLRADRSSWPVTNLYIDTARLIDARETLALADARVGRAFRVAAVPNLMVTPFIGAYAGYDSAQSPKNAVGVGPGVMLRQWLRETPDKAPQSALDLSLQYRIRLGGDKRASGFFLTFSAAY